MLVIDLYMEGRQVVQLVRLLPPPVKLTRLALKTMNLNDSTYMQAFQ